MFAPLVTLFLMREGLAWGGSQSLPIVIIVFIIVRHVRARMRLPSLCMSQFSLVAGPVHCSVFRIRGYPHENGFC